MTTLPIKKNTSDRIFVQTALIAIVANLLLTWGRPYGGDQGYWLDWISHFQIHGFAGFTGNYPPIYLLWLWVVAHIFELLELPLQQGFALKFFCLWPVYAGHLFLLRLLYGRIQERLWSSGIKRAILLAAALNPALLLDGPIWGQVDLLPMVFVCLAFVLVFSKKGRLFAPLCFALALLCKFQTIAFLPVLGGIFLIRAKKLYLGFFIALACSFVVILPFIITDSLTIVLKNAYGNASGFYPYATYNAGNLWMLVLGNTVNDSIIPFSSDFRAESFPLSLLSSKIIGMILFSIVSVWVFIKSLRVQRLSQAAMLGTLMATAFFFLLTQMHERYLLPAIPIALLWLATDFRAWSWVLLLTVVCSINIAMLNGVQGNDLWIPLSMLATVIFLLMAVKILMPIFWNRFAEFAKKIPLPTYVPEVILLIALLGISANQWAEHRHFILEDDELWLSSLPRIESSQGYKSPEQNRSVDGNILRVGRHSYLEGIGTHAPSRFTYTLPPAASRFRFAVGLDKETDGGEVEFRVELDGQEIWKSGTMISADGIAEADIDIKGGTRLTLIVDPLGKDSYDHADWLLPRIKKE
ncbi:hypothetical protein AGMMS49938_12330 [Fibrobacterales bacterium]|nr:hypothetical protein AGMMS49938_12330 [Fibrobacterales bacterium]